MLQEKSVREVLKESIRQQRNVKGEDSNGSFHGVMVETDLESPKVRLLSTGEIRKLSLETVKSISLNGGWSPKA